LINGKLLAVRRSAARAVRSVADFFRSTFWKWNSACGTLRCGKEFSRKDFVKQEKRCITIVVLPSCENPALLTYQIH